MTVAGRNVVLALAVLIVCPCFAKEAVYLKSGFSLEADSHVEQDQTFVFRIGEGTLAFPAGDILRIEAIPADSVSPPLAPSPVTETEKPEQILNQAAYLEGLDEDFVRSVAKVESGLRQEAVSSKGAIGLMQLMPSTAAELGVKADQAPANALGGAKYLRDLLVRYHGNSVLALAAYNAGPEAVAKFGGVPPYPETQRYVLLVLREYQRQKAKKQLLVGPTPQTSASRISRADYRK